MSKFIKIFAREYGRTESTNTPTPSHYYVNVYEIYEIAKSGPHRVKLTQKTDNSWNLGDIYGVVIRVKSPASSDRYGPDTWPAIDYLIIDEEKYNKTLQDDWTGPIFIHPLQVEPEEIVKMVEKAIREDREQQAVITAAAWTKESQKQDAIKVEVSTPAAINGTEVQKDNSVFIDKLMVYEGNFSIDKLGTTGDMDDKILNVTNNTDKSLVGTSTDNKTMEIVSGASMVVKRRDLEHDWKFSLKNST